MNVVRCSIDLETDDELIEVVDTGELAVERFSSDRPVTEPPNPVTSLSRRTRGTKSARNAVSARTKLHLFLPHGRYPRPGIPPSPRPGRTERRFSSRPCVIGQVDPEKRRVVAPGEEPDAPLRQSALPNGYPTSRAWGEGWDTGSNRRSDTRPHPAPRRGRRLSTGRLAREGPA